jgi:hypothetical protein
MDKPNLFCLFFDRLFQLGNLGLECLNLALEIAADAPSTEKQHDQGNQDQRAATEADLLASIVNSHEPPLFIRISAIKELAAHACWMAADGVIQIATAIIVRIRSTIYVLGNDWCGAKGFHLGMQSRLQVNGCR